MDKSLLISHYYNNYKQKIFLTRLSATECDFYVMYKYDYVEEINNFSQTFLKYLPFYVRNSDYFSVIDEYDDLDKLLACRSRTLRKNSKIIPQRTIGTDGIYGELFLDFYLRIVNKYNAIITFANKRSFDSNFETTGPDNIVYFIDEAEKIHICICEAKFVGGAANAHNCLIDDIIGTAKKQGHITKKYLNDYFQFIVEKGNDICERDKKIFKPFLFDLNKQLDAGNDFLSVIINHNICVNFIFFAVFDSTKNDPDKLKKYYDSIYDKCKTNVIKMGITNFKIEIVFIPTTNDTMTLKSAMEKSYE
ncbi:MAG: DUF1837 domain-containing protein [Clostridia bacterium]|nr:DUF1837 domain-containing protein [Clostridia bacterium]